jgi:electron transfer flavoprotein alpha subunit
VALIIDETLCTGCEACIEQCPFDALELADDIARVGEGCNLCGACVDVCPAEAISLEEAEPQDDEGATEASGVWGVAEQRGGVMSDTAAELLGQGRRLADDLGAELGAALLGRGVEGLAAELTALGADVVYMVDHPSLEYFNDDAYCRAITRLIKQYRPEIFLAGATAMGRSLIPRTAAAVGAGLTADCTGLAIDPETRLLLQTRPAFGGNIMATIICPRARPQKSTVRPRVMKRGERVEGRRGRLVSVEWEDGDQPLTQVLEVVQALDEKIDLAGAEVIVTGGRGLGRAEGFDLVREMAEALGGVVGATRGAVDLEWIGHAHQVGQTGRTVAPKLYIALGVSGAVQHLVGMQSSDTIVAVNTDPNAPIFQAADYGIVGDLYEAAPAMLERLKQLRGR